MNSNKWFSIGMALIFIVTAVLSGFIILTSDDSIVVLETSQNDVYVELSALQIQSDVLEVVFFEDFSGRIVYRDFTLSFDNMNLDEIWVNGDIIEISCDGMKNDNFLNNHTCVLQGKDSINEFLEKWLQ